MVFFAVYFHGSIFPTTFLYTCLGLFFAGVLVFAISFSENSFLHKILTSKILTIFGKYSYSIYLFHVSICIIFSATFLKHIKAYLPSPIIVWGIFFLMISVTSFGIGVITYRFYESHFLKLKDILAPLYAKD